MSCARLKSVAARSRLHLEVKSKKIIGSIFCVLSITLSFLDGFSNYLV